VSLTPTTLSIRKLEADGWRVDVVERKVTRIVTHDLFGIIDLIAIKGAETLAVQVTSRSNISARVRKITDSEALADVRDAGWTLLVHGWDQYNGKDRLKIVDLS